MRYIGLSAREAYNVLMDYRCSCEGATLLLAAAIDTGESISLWFYICYEPLWGFFVKVFYPETHHTPSDQCLHTTGCDPACGKSKRMIELNKMAYQAIGG